MNSRSIQVAVISGALILFGLCLILYKTLILNYPFTPEARAEIWTVETRLSLTGTGQEVSAEFATPSAPAGFALVDEDAIAPGFGTSATDDETGRRMRVEQRSLEGTEQVFVLSRFYKVDSAQDSVRETGSEEPESVALALESLGEASDAGREAIESVVQTAREQSVDALGTAREIARIYTSESAVTDAVAGMDFDRLELSEPARRLAFTLNVAGIEARRATGIPLETNRRNAPIMAWTEVATNDRGWVALDPATGEPWDDLPLARLGVSDTDLIDVSGAMTDDWVYATKRSYTAEIDRALWNGDRQAPIFTRLSPLILSVEAQLVFQVLLLLPIGALAVAFIRQVIGIKTFGTFMPVLIALAFRETQLVLGVSLFLAIVLLGLLLRSYFNTLHLTLVPRLTAVLSIVTLIMLVIAVAGAANDVRLGLSLSLFPIVILTMTIESMSLIYDEYGPREAFVRASGSLFTAIVAYLVISIPSLQHIVFVFPEFLLIVIGLAIVLGRYNGFTLHEFVRFRMIGKQS